MKELALKLNNIDEQQKTKKENNVCVIWALYLDKKNCMYFCENQCNVDTGH